MELMPARTLLLLLVLTVACSGQQKRVLYVTHSAGFRHGSIEHSIDVLRDLARANGRLDVDSTEDVSRLNAATLAGYDAVFFFTSGELPITDQQKSDLLAFVRGGKGFGGVHSATDTLYQWPEYNQLIGGTFNGHPWVQEVTLDVEDPDNPIVAHLKPALRIRDEIYQFRNFDRNRVRVLLALDTHSVDLKAPGVNPDTEDFPLAWIRRYGEGRSFYSALGHFDDVWDHPGVRQMLLQALLWLTGQLEADATPRAAAPPVIFANGIANAASFDPRNVISAGSAITIFGENLTSGSMSAADPRDPQYRLAGTTLKIRGQAIPLFYASPTQVNAYVPLDRVPETCSGMPGFCNGPSFPLTLQVAGGGAAGARPLSAERTPGIFTRTLTPGWITLWATGLGPVEARGSLYWTTTSPVVSVDGVEQRVQFSGLAPGWFGLYQVNATLPPPNGFAQLLEFVVGGYTHRLFLLP
jgi:uncharacterized protein (TIGR03437 family)